MLDSIYIGMSGLTAYSRALKTISNNAANLNTPAFKSSDVDFADLVYNKGAFSPSQSKLGDQTAERQGNQSGYGVEVNQTRLVFRQGDFQSTGNDLDAAIDGNGFFVLQDSQGQTILTRSGQFAFNNQDELVLRNSDLRVMAFDQGQLTSIRISDRKNIPGQITKRITLNGNLSSNATTHTINNVVAFDHLGREHNLTLRLNGNATDAAGQWAVEVLEGTTRLGQGQLRFANGQAVADQSSINFNFSAIGLTDTAIAIDFANSVTYLPTGEQSTLAFRSQDGIANGNLLKTVFNRNGELSFSYSNGQSQTGQALALVKVTDPASLQAMSGSMFRAANATDLVYGRAGTDGIGQIAGGELELSNVDLSREFSQLVIMQRGYQASSQIISTSNEMIDVLLSMKRR